MGNRFAGMHDLYALFRDKAGTWAPGYVLALGSAAAVAATPVIRKTISTEVNPATFSVWWYGMAGVYAWILVLIRGDAHAARGIRTGWRPTLVLVLTNASAAILFYTEIDLANPALVSFFGRLRTVYVVLLGVLYLGERLNRQEWTGAVVTVLGTLLVAYRGGAVLNLVFVLALIQNLLMAVATIMAKSAVQHVPPLVLVGYRGVLISLAVLSYAVVTGQWQWVSGRTWAVMATGALAGTRDVLCFAGTYGRGQGGDRHCAAAGVCCRVYGAAVWRSADLSTDARRRVDDCRCDHCVRRTLSPTPTRNCGVELCER